MTLKNYNLNSTNNKVKYNKDPFKRLALKYIKKITLFLIKINRFSNWNN